MSAERRDPFSNLSPTLCVRIAESTLQAVETGSYTLNDQTYTLPDSAKDTEFFNSTALSKWFSTRPETPRTETQTPHIAILEISTLESAHLLSRPDPTSRIGILNFADAELPGGLFLQGALTQEETIARSSTLYQSLTSETASQYYASHRRNPQGGYFSHAMIFSPNVTLFRDDAGEWIPPLEVSVVTSPAVHAGVVRRSPNEEEMIELTMKERMARILYLFESRGVSKLVLGAFGTGVFQNPVPMVARIWAELLGVPGSRFAPSFDTVVFGILGGETYDTFKETFNETSGRSSVFTPPHLLMTQKGVESLPSNTSKASHGPAIREIFSHKPAWWARWTWPLLLGITVWSAVAARTAFYHWTHRVETINESVSVEQDAGANTDPEASKKIKWELRPLSHRAMMSGGILASGTALGIVFLSTRSRIVRRLSLVSHTTPLKRGIQLRRNLGNDLGQPEDFPYVLVESVVNTNGRGNVFLKEGCELSPGRDDSEMWLNVPGGRKFWLGMKGSAIEGAPVPQGAVQKLLEIWNSDTKGGNSRGRWLRGPIVGRYR